MEQYAVVIIIDGNKYYLTSYDKTLSKSVQDSMLFLDEKVALYYASKFENEIGNCLGKIEKVNIFNLL